MPRRQKLLIQFDILKVLVSVCSSMDDANPRSITLQSTCHVVRLEGTSIQNSRMASFATWGRRESSCGHEGLLLQKIEHHGCVGLLGIIEKKKR